MMLRTRRIPLDTLRENVAVLASNCAALRPEAFQAFKRLEIQHDGRSIVASLDICHDHSMVGPDEIGLTEPAFRRMGLPEGSTVTIAPARSPQSLDYVRTKIGGETLNRHQIEAIIHDIVGYRYSDMEIAAFLVACAGFLSTDELLDLTRAMASAGNSLVWDAPMVVDKHCIGGIPGNRTSMIVVPIVAAHGLTIPKTSSRAITSPAGTADTMEILARVDLTTEEMRAVVGECNGCLVWGGHVNLSPADDILIGVERPLNLDTREQMVASIMSKKKSAGSTHLVVDIPLGPTAKVRDAGEAMRLRKLFEFVADRIGLHVEVMVTDGAQPVGRGIGPVLEARDVMAVLANDAAAPADLREKSLRLAARVIESDAAVRGGTGYDRARELLDSGAAMTVMQKIIAAQGRAPAAPPPGPLTADVLAHADGIVASVDCLRIAQLARLAGAPLDRGAGLDILKRVGDKVEAGEPLYRIYSAGESHFDFAVDAAEQANGFALAGLGGMSGGAR
ncbi:thymidine phosphorylase family protein [Parvibaculum sp.]|uniref:thymidine phosphorylase family protein n=1 Tax=Parvibaculum sp. TaxID=2024848 RepID=UPI0027316966|nr:thymidine phosphorylase family protein [Parvibaculum sp.]MDP1627696.1 thymidine phosphorylase family protein [Parvibaculum sp.]MDP2150694.1 thymidine phosphorylase family protein [Parvibaculum sp.]MDP3328034.1 thymidine phosphorylase family protein [Parvibaculum sp.]